MDDAGHLPVLLDEVLELLVPALHRQGSTDGKRVIIDCTVGCGGHARALLEASAGKAMLIGIDLDESALLKTKQRLAEFAKDVRLFQANFSEVRTVMDEAGVKSADVLLADLGVSSAQLQNASRGFSFQVDGPLDMRMSSSGPTAADIVNRLSQKELADLIYAYSQERFSREIAAAIIRARKAAPITRTTQLAEIVTKVIARKSPRRRWRIHPATRTFQALRIAVNKELENLSKLLEVLPSLLCIGGRAAIISFHSLEDRLVKRAFSSMVSRGTHRLLTKKPVRPSPDEIRVNPRSRSARLRCVERIK